MLRYVHRTGVGVVAWRQASSAAVAATCAPRDNHRRIVSRGRVVRGVVGYVISGVGSATGSLAAVTLTASTGAASGTPTGTATCAPRDNHRRVVSRGRVVRAAQGYGVTAIGSASGAPSGIALSPATGSASSAASGAGNAVATLASITLTAATGIQPGADVLDADRFDYRRALRIPNAYAPDPAIARMGQRMTRRNRW